VFLEFRIEHKR